MFLGDILLAACCGFYLLWWALATKPTGAVKGMKSGWLLIPAVLLGGAAAISIFLGARSAAHPFFSVWTAIFVGVLIYAALIAVTWLAFHRQVTTELFLIVGWTVLMFLQGDALYGLGIVDRNAAMGIFVAAGAIAALSMACYLIYYRLDSRAGYVDGMIPLLLVAVFMVVLAMLVHRSA